MDHEQHPGTEERDRGREDAVAVVVPQVPRGEGLHRPPDDGDDGRDERRLGTGLQQQRHLQPAGLQRRQDAAGLHAGRTAHGDEAGQRDHDGGDGGSHSDHAGWGRLAGRGAGRRPRPGQAGAPRGARRQDSSGRARTVWDAGSPEAVPARARSTSPRCRKTASTTASATQTSAAAMVMTKRVRTLPACQRSAPTAAQRDEQDVGRVEDQLDPDQHEHRVAAGQDAVGAEAGEDGREGVGAGQVDHGCASSGVGRQLRRLAARPRPCATPRTRRSGRRGGAATGPRRARPTCRRAARRPRCWSSRPLAAGPATGSSTASRSRSPPPPGPPRGPRWARLVVTSSLGPIGARVSMSAKSTSTTTAPT